MCISTCSDIHINWPFTICRIDVFAPFLDSVCIYFLLFILLYRPEQVRIFFSIFWLVYLFIFYVLISGRSKHNSSLWYVYLLISSFFYNNRCDNWWAYNHVDHEFKVKNKQNKNTSVYVFLSNIQICVYLIVTIHQ